MFLSGVVCKEEDVSSVSGCGKVFFVMQKTAYESRLSLVGSRMCIRGRIC